MQVAFSIDDDPDDACFIAWTTTPWSAPAHCDANWVLLCSIVLWDLSQAVQRLGH